MARPPYPFESHETLEKRVERLHRTIERLREDVVSLAPDEFRTLLWSYHSRDRSNSHQWLDEIAEKIAEEAKPIWGTPAPELFGHRGICPLCRSEGSSVTETGFKLPEGLRRHLVGYGAAHQCVVTKAAAEMARDYWHEKFYEEEQREEREKTEIKRKRIAEEELFVGGPFVTPELWDEHAWSYRPVRPRTDEHGGFSWAEGRLKDLGFEKVNTDRLISYKRHFSLNGEEFVAYADPRITGEIKFRLYRADATRRKCDPVARVDIQDRWTKSLSERLHKAFEEAVDALPRRVISARPKRRLAD